MTINLSELAKSLPRVSTRKPPVVEYQPQPTELTFSVTNDYPDKVMEADSSRHRAIGLRRNQFVYSILAPNLSLNDIATAKRVKAKVIESLLSINQNDGSAVAIAYNNCMAELAKYNTNENREVIAYLVAHDIVGCGALSILLEDAPNIEEIEINSPTSNIAVYHSRHGRCLTNLRFNSEKDFRYSINKLIAATEKELNTTSPVIDAQLLDGSRVHAQLKPYSISGATASIRLNSGKGIDIRRLMELGTVSPEVLAYLWMAVENGQNIVIAGAPAAGKTSLLLSINAFAPSYQRIVTIEEDINELKFYNNFINVVSLQGSTKKNGVGLRDQVINALHLRPERLIIGEIRGPEAMEVFAGANLGIPFMTTMHSSANGQAIINRLTTKPMSVEPHAICMLDLSVFTRQDAQGKRHAESIVEYRWHSRAEIGMEEAAALKDADYKVIDMIVNGELDAKALKDSKVVGRYAETNLLSRAAALKEHKKRTQFLEKLKNSGPVSVHEYMAKYMEIK